MAVLFTITILNNCMGNRMGTWVKRDFLWGSKELLTHTLFNVNPIKKVHLTDWDLV